MKLHFLDYEELAVKLAEDMDHLYSMRKHIEQCRNSCAAFDTNRWVNNLEKGLEMVWKRHEKNQHPDHIEIIDDEPVFILQDEGLLE